MNDNRLPHIVQSVVRLDSEMVHTEWGDIEFYSRDNFVGASLREYGWYSKGEINLFQKICNPTSIVIEAGANIGAFSVPMARWAQHVIAFEPQPDSFFLLMANARRNKLANLWARHSALGAASGLTHMPYLAEIFPEGNFGGIETGQGTYPVAVEAIDELVKNLRIPHIDFIKADVEGKEHEVFTGAAETIMKFRPILYFENDRRDKSEALLKLVRSFRYRMYWHIPYLHEGADRNIWQSEFGSYNVLALPEESPIRVTDQPEIESDNVFVEPLKALAG